MTVRIIPASLRDLSYIAANLRPDDFAEVDCQLDHWTPALLASVALRDHSYVAEANGNPEAAFGAGKVRQGYWVAWSWGTPRMGRAVPHITRFVRTVMIPEIIASGGLRCEARALQSNLMACKWLDRMGAHPRCELPMFGKNGETFILYDWTADDVSLLDARHSGTEAASDRTDA